MTVFVVTSQKKVFIGFCKCWAQFFSNESTLGAIFAGIFRDLVQISADFAQIFTKSTFGGALAPLPPTPLFLTNHS